ncbi:hypothetical protein KVU_0201 [Ketogulonicigenium vulgare WSH-001]|uniref:Uncharacterized protein n=1 Tax=Ketogulonicigenium vulgare (strain WSH-001) TaxID=759362 RepID=F9Y8Y4_KETVW|nr:hypothetical protein KVU_0201 [Ketogulonicigenium vulgare WSH-001]
MVQRRASGAFAIKTTARRGDDDLFRAGQPLRAVFGIAEGHARDGKAVDPGFQLAGNGKVIHRRANDREIGGHKLLQRGLASGQVICRSSAAQMCAGQVIQRCGGEVAMHNACIRVLCDLRRKDFGGQQAADRGIAGNSGVNVKNVHFRIRLSDPVNYPTEW